jgi:hypothetical protein
MSMFIITLLSVLLVCSISTIILLIKSLRIQLKKIEIYQSWIVDLKQDVEDTYIYIKELDNKNIFVKDDEVGVVFQDMLSLIEKLKERSE